MSSSTENAPQGAASTPGPRATALHSIYNEALNHTVKSISYEHFASCFPTPAKYCPDSLRRVWSQMMGRFEELSRNEFDDVLRERDVIRLLNELDRLVAEASKRKEEAASNSTEPASIPVAPHSLSPEALLRAHIAPYMLQHEASLRAQQEIAQTQNSQLLATIGQQREEIQQLLRQLEGALGDINGAVDTLQETPGEGQGATDAAASWIASETERMDDELSRLPPR